MDITDTHFLFIEWRFLLVLAAFFTLLYWRIWPEKQATRSKSTLVKIILRWCHSLTWLLLLTASILAITGGSKSLLAVQSLALTSLVCYLLFISSFILSKKSKKN